MSDRVDSTSEHSIFARLQEAIAPRLGVMGLTLAGLTFQASKGEATEPLRERPAVQSLDSAPEDGPQDTFVQTHLENDKISGTFNGQEVSGQLQDDYVRSVSLDGATCTLNSPVEAQSLSPLLKELAASIRLWRSEFPETPIAEIDTVDGESFILSAGNQKTLCIHGELFTATSVLASEEQSHVETDSLESQFAETISSLIPEQYKQEMTRRILYKSLITRVSAVQDKITAQIQSTANLPYNLDSWKSYEQGFKRKVLAPFQATSKTASLNKLQEIEKSLKSYEESLSLASSEELSFPLLEQSQIAERLDRSQSINTRRDTVEKLLKENPQTRQRFTEFDREWRQIVNSWNKPFGWERWDPESLPQDKHRSVVVQLDTLLKQFESGELPEGAVPDNTLASQYRMQQIQIEASATAANIPKQVYTFTADTGEELLTLTVQDDTVTRKFQQDTAEVTEKVTEGILSSRTIRDDQKKSSEYFGEGGKLQYRYDYRKGGDEHWALASLTRFHANGSVRYVSTPEAANFYCQDGKPLMRLDVNKQTKQIEGFSVITADGNELLDFPREKSKNSLSASQYIQKLSKILDSGEKLHIFFDTSFKYTSDATEKWQTGEESVQRVSEGRMRGDCDDYAFLARAILHHQGQHPHVLNIPNHALCIWLTVDADGKYHARSIGTFGYDHNGSRYDDADFAESQAGQPTLKDAVNSVLKKYRFAGLGLEEGQDYQLSGNSAQILDLDNHGRRSSSWWGLDLMIRHSSY